MNIKACCTWTTKPQITIYYDDYSTAYANGTHDSIFVDITEDEAKNLIKSLQAALGKAKDMTRATERVKKDYWNNHYA